MKKKKKRERIFNSTKNSSIILNIEIYIFIEERLYNENHYRSSKNFSSTRVFSRFKKKMNNHKN